MSLQAPDALVAQGLDMIRGETAAQPDLADDPDAYASAVEEVPRRM